MSVYAALVEAPKHIQSCERLGLCTATFLSPLMDYDRRVESRTRLERLAVMETAEAESLLLQPSTRLGVPFIGR